MLGSSKSFNAPMSEHQSGSFFKDLPCRKGFTCAPRADAKIMSFTEETPRVCSSSQDKNICDKCMLPDMNISEVLLKHLETISFPLRHRIFLKCCGERKNEVNQKTFYE